MIRKRMRAALSHEYKTIVATDACIVSYLGGDSDGLTGTKTGSFASPATPQA